jgi:undecaprenyl-diphosphatase
VWDRPRPSAAHGDAVHLYFVSPSQDPSFPSDHATAAFAIAFAVFFVSRRVGIGFLLTAAAIGLARVLIGLHYPGDVAAGAVVGLAGAALVHVVARRPLAHVVAAIGRLTDPLLCPLWRLAAGRLPRARP